MNEIYIGQKDFYRFHQSRLFQALHENEKAPSFVGAEYVARILRLEKGLEGAIVDLGLLQPGFLPLRSSKKASSVHEGQIVLVQIKRDGFDHKGPRLELKNITPEVKDEIPYCTRRPLALWERNLPSLDSSQIKAIHCERRLDQIKITEWAKIHAQELTDHIHYLPRRDWPDMREYIMAALDNSVSLPGGGNLIFEQTHGLNVVDVNSGAMVQQAGMEQTAWCVDHEAASEIPRQLSLRNWGGITIIDFIDLKSAKRRSELVEYLRMQSAQDPLIEWVGPMSRLGLVEIKRRRKGKTLAEMFSEEELSRLR